MTTQAVNRRQSIASLIRIVAKAAQITVEDILSHKRARKYSVPRQFIMFMAAQMGFSTTRIGAILNRDHSTVIHGIRAEKARREQAGAASRG